MKTEYKIRSKIKGKEQTRKWASPTIYSWITHHYFLRNIYLLIKLKMFLW